MGRREKGREEEMAEEGEGEIKERERDIFSLLYFSHFLASLRPF